MDGCDMLGVVLSEGASLSGYFTRELVDGKYVYTPCNANATVPADNTTEYFEPKDIGKFYAFGSMQDLSMPIDGAISVSYGASCYASTTTGSLMNSLQVNSYSYDNTGRGMGMVPYLLSVANSFVTVDAVNGLTATTLGTVGEKQGLSIAVNFPTSYYSVQYLDGTGAVSGTVTLNKNTCGDVYTVLTDEYDTWQVNGVVYEAGATVAINGDTVIAPGFLALNAAAGDNAAGNAAGAEDTSLALGAAQDADTAGEQSSLAVILLVSVLGCAVIAAGVIIAKKRKA